MRYNKEIKHFVECELKKCSADNLKMDVGIAIHQLSKYNYAESNVNQIYFYTRVLHYLKYKYNEKSKLPIS